MKPSPFSSITLQLIDAQFLWHSGFNIPVLINGSRLNCHWINHRSVDLNNFIMIRTVCLPQKEANQRVMNPNSKHGDSDNNNENEDDDGKFNW